MNSCSSPPPPTPTACIHSSTANFEQLFIVFACPVSNFYMGYLDRKGFGEITAAGGQGWGGGGGGRISLNCNSRQEDVKVTVHGLC